MGYQDDYKPRWLRWADDAADWLAKQTWNRIFGSQHHDWHTWIHHGILTLLLGGGIGTLVAWPISDFTGWPIQLGPVIGTLVMVRIYIWREAMTVKALGVFTQDNVGDVLGPLAAFLLTSLALFPLYAGLALLGLVGLFYAVLFALRVSMVYRDTTFGVLVLELPSWWRPSGRSMGIRFPGFKDVWAILAPDDQAPLEKYRVTVRHEGWGHGPQWARYGFFGFLWRYSDPYGRRRMETVAMAHSVTERIWHGGGLQTWVRHYASHLATDYSMPENEDFSLETLGLMILAEYEQLDLGRREAA